MTDGKTEVITYTLPSGISEDKALDYIRDEYETKNNKVIMIQATRTTEKVYGMTEVKFMELAQELDAETRKALTPEERKEETQEIDTDNK